MAVSNDPVLCASEDWVKNIPKNKNAKANNELIFFIKNVFNREEASSIVG